MHVNIQRQREIRRRNAHVLYQALEGQVRFLFTEDRMDCPLFVPVFLPQGRDELRQRLIRERIYCPVHWPRPKAACSSNLYDAELSLVCDQRYTERDMERMAAVLRR